MALKTENTCLIKEFKRRILDLVFETEFLQVIVTFCKSKLSLGMLENSLSVNE